MSIERPPIRNFHFFRTRWVTTPAPSRSNHCPGWRLVRFSFCPRSWRSLWGGRLLSRNATRHPRPRYRRGRRRRLPGTTQAPVRTELQRASYSRVPARTGRSDQSAAEPPVLRETHRAVQNPPGFRKPGAVALGRRQGFSKVRKSRVNSGLIGVAAGLLLEVRSFRISPRSSRWPMWPSYASRSRCSRWRLSSPGG